MEDKTLDGSARIKKMMTPELRQAVADAKVIGDLDKILDEYFYGKCGWNGNGRQAILDWHSAELDKAVRAEYKRGHKNGYHKARNTVYHAEQKIKLYAGKLERTAIILKELSQPTNQVSKGKNEDKY